MSKQEELQVFLEANEDLINSKYILSEIKIVNVLKSIASSETILALFKNSMVNFDYAVAKEKYLVKNKLFSGDRGEFVCPTNARELLAFVLSLLMDIDAKRINFGEFLNKYFFEDGSYSASFSQFVQNVIRPFCDTVKTLMQSVIEGKLQDPLEALVEQEERLAKEKLEQERQAQIDKELSQKAYGESVKSIKEILLADKTKVKLKNIKENEKEQIILVIDTLANAIQSDEKDKIIYSYVAYRYMAKAHRFIFFGRAKKVGRLLKDVLNAI